MESRELIMRRLLSKEKVDEGLDFKELATMTEGYSGSDLKVSSMKHECTHMPPCTPKNKNKDTMLNSRELCIFVLRSRDQFCSTLNCSLTEPVHDGSISPCEGANPERKKEGAGNQTKPPAS